MAISTSISNKQDTTPLYPTANIDLYIGHHHREASLCSSAAHPAFRIPGKTCDGKKGYGVCGFLCFAFICFFSLLVLIIF
ncbi:hypothetical protein I7I53_10882 [Histoplasma capsulatum var. duboisii H88]|uniref:Transmembrane protein n=1 Tax=Ajellomyces capsulatus (strain H88) TaxID=544711 RepID=A0A8A1LBP1_AJEC8|nr:hypothetical protein I7I53_10882 [Histoplasma capsulatum var. duboisii H88]